MFKKSLGWLVVGNSFFILLLVPMQVVAITIPDTHCIYKGCDDKPSQEPVYTPPTRDYEAERREQEAAVEEQRKRAAELEQQRREAEDKRIKEEQERKEKFIRDRNKVKLRGSSGMSITPNTSDGSGLKGSSSSETGLRGAKPASNRDQGKQATAWKQLHCASSVTGFALRALQGGDLEEFGDLSVQALKALDGGRMDVECPATPAMPTPKGGEVDMERLQSRERQVLEKAGKIAERMKKREANKADVPSSKTVPTNETDLEKKVRVQKELNKINQQKIAGNQKEIAQQEKERKELAKLLLENNNLIDVKVNIAEEAPKTKGQKRKEPPSPQTR